MTSEDAERRLMVEDFFLKDLLTKVNQQIARYDAALKRVHEAKQEEHEARNTCL